MLSDFLTENRAEILARCRSRVAARMAPRPTELELEHGIPLFLDQVAETLRARLGDSSVVTASAGASMHGSNSLRMGFTVGQVVQDYGDVCQTITEMAIERAATITTTEFQTLNMCLDEAIAQAVTGYGEEREIDVAAEVTGRVALAGVQQAASELGFFAHELRNLLGTAMLAFEALKDGSVGVGGSTSAVLGRSLGGLSNLIDRTLADVRLTVGIDAHEKIEIGALIEEVEVSAIMATKARGHQLTVETTEPDALVEVDRQIFGAVIANLVQNACKYTRECSHVVLRTTATPSHVTIEVEDECGGLAPGIAETLFAPFEQRNTDRSGLGLGLAICVRGVAALDGSLSVRDLPGKGCVFTVELPRVPLSA